MRSTLVMVLVVTVIAVGVCLAAGAVLTEMVEDADALADRALETALGGDRDGAAELLREIRAMLEGRAALYEALSPHDELHEVGQALEDAEKCLESGDMDDFDRAIGRLKECLAHIREAEQLKFSNIL